MVLAILKKLDCEALFKVEGLLACEMLARLTCVIRVGVACLHLLVVIVVKGDVNCLEVRVSCIIFKELEKLILYIE